MIIGKQERERERDLEKEFRLTKLDRSVWNPTKTLLSPSHVIDQ